MQRAPRPVGSASEQGQPSGQSPHASAASPWRPERGQCHACQGCRTLMVSAAMGRATTWQARKAGTDDGSIPADVSLNDLATVTAGLAKLVDAVKKYAAPMYDATAAGARPVRPVRTSENTTT